MNKTQVIKLFIDQIDEKQVTFEFLAEKLDTTVDYVRDKYKKIKDLEKVFSEPDMESWQLKKDDANFETEISDFEIEEVLSEVKGFEITPKVEELPNGKVQVIYQSKMNYELH